MNNNLAVHHHFRFSGAFIKNPTRCRQVSFQSIPFFKIYSWSSLDYVIKSLDKLTEEMPHRYQKIVRSLAPPVHFNHSYYRQELYKLNYCVFRRQAFFVRVYYLHQNGGKFFKVEIVLHSNTLGAGKYYNWEKALRAAEEFFKLLDQAVDLCPIKYHLPEFFTISDFTKEVRLRERRINSLYVYQNRTIRKRLIEEQRQELKEYQKDAKRLAASYLSGYARGREPPR